MVVRRGDVPVRVFQRGLLSAILQMYLGLVFFVGAGLWLFGKTGMILGSFAAVFWGFGDNYPPLDKTTSLPKLLGACRVRTRRAQEKGISLSIWLGDTLPILRHRSDQIV